MLKVCSAQNAGSSSPRNRCRKIPEFFRHRPTAFSLDGRRSASARPASLVS
jgi:hypothetical protein